MKTWLLTFQTLMLGALLSAHAESSADSAAKTESTSTNEYLWSGVAVKELAKITVDCSEVPELKDWAQHAWELCVQWYPKICDLLPSEGFVPPHEVKLVFRKDMEGVAATSRDTISIAAKYVEHHTNDWGMVIHELTHVVQNYGRARRNPGWLVEGVADYIRLTHFEPEARRPRIDPAKAKYTDAYKTTAIFLECAEKNYDKKLVEKLNAAMREGSFNLGLFKEITGKTIDELWTEFADSLRKPPGESKG